MMSSEQEIGGGIESLYCSLFQIWKSKFIFAIENKILIRKAERELIQRI